ncbi:MAG: hypothetical protein P4L16_02145 [Chlamydiales bacterium]|nr:hypothetical protein [Chlamydiales bacterium]
MFTLSILIGLPIVGAITTIILGVLASAPGCFLLTLGFCLIAAITMPFSLKLVANTFSKTK